jgi:hypothetical protein
MLVDELIEKLAHPEKYVTADSDVPIMKLVTEDNPDNPVLIMLGYDEEKGKYYLVAEDNEISEDYYGDPKDLGYVFCEMIKDFVDQKG